MNLADPRRPARRPIASISDLDCPGAGDLVSMTNALLDTVPASSD